MKKLVLIVIILTMLFGVILANAQTTAESLGDISRGNHPLSGLSDVNIVVPRPSSSKYQVPIDIDVRNIEFSDIAGHWAEDAIHSFVGSGYISGYPNGTFCPDKPITYAEFATIVARLKLKPVRFNGGFYVSNSLRSNQNAWYYVGFMIASEAGIFGNQAKISNEIMRRTDSPYDIGNVNANAKRQVVSLFLANMLEERDGALPFKDSGEIVEADITKAVESLVHNEIIAGYPDGTFRPNGTITRAELVGILTRIIARYNGDMLRIHDNLYGNYNKYFWGEETKVINLLNQERSARALNQLSYDANLRALAYIKQIDMVTNGYFDHVSSTFGDPYEMSLSFGIRYTTGENLTTVNRTAQLVHESWLNSSGHYYNMINIQHSKIGVAIGDGCSVELFGR